MRSEDIKYVIIQAGGKGIRMGRYAENKPKCLVPVKGIPMIMNTIEKYKDKEIIIIAIVKQEKIYFRPNEVHNLVGDFRKAKKLLKWKPKINFEQLISEMIDSDLKQII